jgi:hypothetical protein
MRPKSPQPEIERQPFFSCLNWIGVALNKIDARRQQKAPAIVRGGFSTLD